MFLYFFCLRSSFLFAIVTQLFLFSVFLSAKSAVRGAARLFQPKWQVLVLSDMALHSVYKKSLLMKIDLLLKNAMRGEKIASYIEKALIGSGNTFFSKKRCVCGSEIQNNVHIVQEFSNEMLRSEIFGITFILSISTVVRRYSFAQSEFHGGVKSLHLFPFAQLTVQHLNRLISFYWL